MVRCAANRSWSPPLMPSSLSTWIAWLSVLGSVCYLIGRERRSRSRRRSRTARCHCFTPPHDTTNVFFFNASTAPSEWFRRWWCLSLLSGSLQAPEHLAEAMASRSIGLAWLAPGWPMLFIGFFLGSLVFLAQSVLMIHEITVSAEEEE